MQSNTERKNTERIAVVPCNYVVISHGDTLSTLYQHLSGTACYVGQSVSAGDTIGYAGSTGISTGTHLHFEVHVYGTPVDPMGYL